MCVTELRGCMLSYPPYIHNGPENNKTTDEQSTGSFSLKNLEVQLFNITIY